MLEFSRSEQLTLRAWYGTTTSSRLAATLRRTPEEIHAEAVRLGLRSPTKASLAAIEASEAKEVAYRKRNLAEMAEAARLRAEKPRKEKPVKEVKIPHAVKLAQRNAAMLAEYPFVDNPTLRVKYDISQTRLNQLARSAGITKSGEYLSKMQCKDAGGRKAKAIRQAAELLKSGDHLAALDVLEGALS